MTSQFWIITHLLTLGGSIRFLFPAFFTFENYSDADNERSRPKGCGACDAAPLGIEHCNLTWKSDKKITQDARQYLVTILKILLLHACTASLLLGLFAIITFRKSPFEKVSCRRMQLKIHHCKGVRTHRVPLFQISRPVTS
jgi:hypothetical protein